MTYEYLENEIRILLEDATAKSLILGFRQIEKAPEKINLTGRKAV